MNRLLATAGRVVDRIKINTLKRHERDGRAVWSKQRRNFARLVIPMANGFFRLAGNPVSILLETDTWHAWEIACLRRLHGDGFAAWTSEPGVLWIEELPGRSLSLHLDAGTATHEMFAAAAREFRRAHGLECEWFGSGWSHGDPHTGNVIYDEASGTARLIDFEMRHDVSLSEAARHTDDLLIFLQDTLGRMPRERWLELARVFVEAYGRSEITAKLVERLAAPRGLARIWWAVRTTYLAPREVAGRLNALRQALVA
jgi:tRNA A-37 threonylcarbamoyl transferase component Bud32